MPKKIGFVLPYLICHQFQASLSSKWLEKRFLEAALHSLLTINLRSKTSHSHFLQQTAATHETHTSYISHIHLTLLQRRSKGGRRNSAQTTAPYSCAALRAGPWDLQSTVSRDFDTCPPNSPVHVHVACDVPGYKVESRRCLPLGFLESLILQNLVIRTSRAGLRYPFHVQTQPQVRVKR